MRYQIGVDPETNELLIGETDARTIILRGPCSEEEDIKRLVRLANEAGESMTIGQLLAVYEEQYPELSDSGWLARASERDVIRKFLDKVEEAVEAAEEKP